MDKLGLVPTMGNLHRGHLSLLEMSLSANQTTVLTIFVNPTQFSPSEDLDQYPRTFEADLEGIQKVHQKHPQKDIIIFHPKDPTEVYPKGDIEYYPTSELCFELEGNVRPTHFRGVLTVVKLLFELIKPTRAYFGKKDYQQFVLISKMVKETGLPVEVIAGELVRDKTGLALSSRNSYLSEEQKKKALLLSTSLREVATSIQEKGLLHAQEKIQSILNKYKAFNYLEVRNPETLALPNEADKKFIVLGNFNIHTINILDNIEVHLGS